MNLNEAAENAYKSVLQRQHNGADVKVAEILKHCAGEVIEAHEESKYAEELADVIICALIAAKRDGIDIERAVSLKMQINAQRAAMLGDKL